MKRKPNISEDAAGLRRRAQGRLRDQQTNRPPPRTDAGIRRLLHELEVHQIELEMQNTELRKARDEVETALETYTDLYDFAPAGYFSFDEQGLILEVNLTGAAMLGMERSRLINRRFHPFLAPASQAVFLAFLRKVLASQDKHVCEVSLLNEAGVAFSADLLATPAASLRGARKWCRVAALDTTARKRAEEAQRRLEAVTATNQELNREIARRQTVEEALKKSEQYQSKLLEQSRDMHEQLRHLSHQVLRAQEEERKRISRELHDEIAQTLVGINVHLETLTRATTGNNQGLKKQIVRTQRLVEKSVEIVHRFARELRPTALDDLGLIPALHSFMKEFAKRTGIQMRFTAFAAVEQVDTVKRTVLFRVAQEALSNVARHARATQVELSIQKLPGAVRMNINDNGQAFDVQHRLLSKNHKRLGLLGMRERVEMVGGSFSVESEPGKGTSVRAQIPIDDGPGELAPPLN